MIHKTKDGYFRKYKPDKNQVDHDLKRRELRLHIKRKPQRGIRNPKLVPLNRKENIPNPSPSPPDGSISFHMSFPSPREDDDELPEP